jgi:hypothetical protein
MLLCKRGDNTYIFDVARSSCNAREHATTISQPSQDARTQQPNFYHPVNLKDDSKDFFFSVERKEQQRRLIATSM